MVSPSMLSLFAAVCLAVNSIVFKETLWIGDGWHASEMKLLASVAKLP
jgi:hypothetical protein